MNKIKKLVAVIVTIASMMTLFTLYASAETNIDMTWTSFPKKWEKTTHFYIAVSGIELTEVGTMIWGYNTFMFNEDYCTTRGWEHNKSTARLKRVGYDNGFVSGNTAATTYFSNVEIRHKTSNVIYRITLSGNYNNHEIKKTTIDNK